MSGTKFIKKAFRFTGMTLLVLVLFIAWWGYAPDTSVEELKVEYAKPPSSFLSFQGMEVHYRIEGKGTPLLLIHGTGASLHTWDDWTEQLKNDFAIIRLDLPGFGLTGPHPEARYKVSEYALFIDDFMHALGIDQFSLAGNSLGGAIAWQYAGRFPEKVDKLILIDPSGIPKEGQPAFIFQIARNPISGALMKHLTPRSMIADNLEEVYFDDSRITPELIDRYHALTRRAGNRQAFIDRAKTEDVSDTSLLRKIKAPTLIQWGQFDDWIPVEDAKIFAAKIARSEVIIYENAGHVPMEEIPVQSASDALKFLMETHQ